jgi:hypothetical protein
MRKWFSELHAEAQKALGFSRAVGGQCLISKAPVRLNPGGHTNNSGRHPGEAVKPLTPAPIAARFAVWED